jgi:hypothetical protein
MHYFKRFFDNIYGFDFFSGIATRPPEPFSPFNHPRGNEPVY